MSSDLEKRLRDSDIVDLWRRRAEGARERRTLEAQLQIVGEEISLLDRLLFFHTSENEAAERRIKERLTGLAEMLGQTSAEIERFWKAVCQESPEVRRVRDLEEVLRRSLVARSSHELRSALQACRDLLEPTLVAYSERLPGGEVPPERALSQLFEASQISYLRPLASLAALLELAAPLTEPTWEGERATVSYRPVLLSLVGQVMESFLSAEPENPFPSQLVSGWLEKDYPGAQLPMLPQSMEEIYVSNHAREVFAELQSMLEELAGHDLALRVTRREISWLDRAIFWSDTPAEARERILLSNRAALVEDIGSHWLELERDLRSRRRESWEIYRCDQSLAVRDALRAISTPSGESSRAKDCPLLNQEQAVWQVAQFVNEVGQRFGVVPPRQLLLEQALSSPQAGREEDGSASLEVLAMDRLAEHLGPLLLGQGFSQRYDSLMELRKQAEGDKEKLREIRGQISTWDRVNGFKETEEEAREKALAETIAQSVERATALQSEVETELETLLAREHPAALVGLLLGELAIAVDAIRAECASFTRSYQDSEGKTHYETMYSCVLRGIDEAGALLKRLLAANKPEPGGYLSPWEAAEAWALLDSPHARAIRALELTEDL